jgi:SAM-dependent methyltransferase
MSDVRDAFIARVVAGQTFADVGGLWGVVNEKASVAWKAGAFSVAMIDWLPADDPLWRAFHDRMRAAETPVEAIAGDVQRLADLPGGPSFDVVHCSGVVYHAPEPTRFLAALRRLTRKHCVLTSTIAPAVVQQATKDGWLYIPALGGVTRQLLADHWRPILGATALGITAHCEWNPNDFAPWWWLPTPDGLKRRCESVGFEVLDEAPFWDGNAHTLLLRAA